MRRILLLLLAAGACSLFLHSACPAQQFVFDELSDAHLRRILRGMGYREIEVIEDTDSVTTMSVVINDWNVILMNYHEAGNVRMFAVFTNEAGETEETLELANTWNRDRRYSKLLIDDDGAWILEADFDVSCGITELQLETWIDVWVVRLNNFVDFLDDNTSQPQAIAHETLEPLTAQ